jgi:hypothetical protein
MPKSWKISIKMLFIMALFIGFSFVLVEQRLESKTYEARIKNLQTAMADINFQKRELMIQIESEMQRLSSYNYNNIGKPISMNDIIVVPLEADTTSDVFALKANPTSMDRFVAFLFNAGSKISQGFPSLPK